LDPHNVLKLPQRADYVHLDFCPQGDLRVIQEQADHAAQENNAMRMQIMSLQKEVGRENLHVMCAHLRGPVIRTWIFCPGQWMMSESDVPQTLTYTFL
jgi:hypothetical protein